MPAQSVLAGNGSSGKAKRERLGWYAYEAALTPYWVGVMQLMPVLILEQAREVAHRHFCAKKLAGLDLNVCLKMGWAADFEHQGSCRGAAALGSQSECVAAGGSWHAEELLEATRVPFLFWEVHYAACRQVADVISVVLQVFAFTLLSSMADYGNLRKRMLAVCTYFGVASMFLHVFGVSADRYWLNTLLIIASSFSFSFAGVFYNSYLPLLVNAKVSSEVGGSTASREDESILWEEASAEVSADGLIWGYVAQLVFMLLGCAWLYITGGAWMTYISFTLTCAVWALAIASAALLRLRGVAGRDLIPEEGFILVSVRRLVSTLRALQKDLTQMRIFLLGWCIHSDGAATVGAAATTFAAKELSMPAFVIMGALMELSLLGVLGAKFAAWLTKRDVRPKTVVLLTIGMMAIPPAWGILALTTWAEFFAAAGLYGFAAGGYNTVSRSLFAGCIPRGREAEFFGFYEVTNRGTAWAGPLLMAWIATSSGSYRVAFGSVVVFFVAGGSILALFDAALAQQERAQVQAADPRAAAKDVQLTPLSACQPCCEPVGAATEVFE